MKFILPLIFFFITTITSGQGMIDGVVRDESNESLVGAHILIRALGKGAIANENGNFRITGIPAGKYEAEISFLGYITQKTIIEVSHQQTTSLSTKLTPGEIQLADVTVTAQNDRPVNTLSQIDVKFRPVNTSQDILRMVPGLFIAQHAGGGKAEQIFLRGFDADHGTDVNVEVDGLPVNMVSHAHGQGYADLHFLIPELVNYVDFDKGPYFADKGDFNTAGYVAFQTKNRLDRNFIKIEGGSFGTGRTVAGFNIPMKSSKSNAYIASEIFRSDGYFNNPQKFNRLNIQAKYNNQVTTNTRLTAVVTAFDSHWDASGQVPDRAIENNTISRFGSLDPTEGGNTGRFNAYVKLNTQLPNGASLENQLYAVRYNFSLFSNFTFFLKDSVNGDQIHQQEQRWVYGYKTHYTQSSTFFGKSLKSEVGGGFRYDAIKNIALSHTVKRDFLNDVKRGDINEGNVNAFVSETLSITDKLSVNAAVRFDYLHFFYNDQLTSTQSPSVGRSAFSPKLNINYQATSKVSLFARSGYGFHSNDARVVVAQGGQKVLPKALGVDLGADIKINPRLLFHTALWRLDLDQEFVYVGDEGVVEPSGETERMGIDMSVRQQLASWLFLDVDVNLSKPKFKSVPDGENFVPLAPVFTSIGGLTFKNGNGINGSIRYRYIGDRPANEDNTVVAKGYIIADAIVNYTLKTFELGLSVENILNAKWKEAQFDTESRLHNEPSPVSEIHFTPGTPLALKLRVIKYF